MERVPVTNPNQSNPRKIHSAIFIEHIEDYVVKYTAERVMEALQEAYSKYKMMETTLSRSKEGMKLKIPEIKKALEIVEALDKKHEEEVTLDFLLTDAVWAKAKIPKGNQSVHLWLGANIMVEYSFKEALELLNRNLENANQNLRVFDEDLSFLKDQITTMEVNIARVYNQNVKNMQAAQLKQQQKELEEKATK